MTRWLLRLYPRWFRERYGDELAELLASSTHRLRDVLNVAVHAGQLRWEIVMSRRIRYLADAVVLVTVFGLGYIVNDLEDGVTEIGRHWWSSIALVVTVLSIGGRTAADIIDTRRGRPPGRRSAP
jgi:hypothetical protein